MRGRLRARTIVQLFIEYIHSNGALCCEEYIECKTSATVLTLYLTKFKLADSLYAKRGAREKRAYILQSTTFKKNEIDYAR